jgi:hypothetical protein
VFVQLFMCVCVCVCVCSGYDTAKEKREIMKWCVCVCVFVCKDHSMLACDSDYFVSF